MVDDGVHSARHLRSGAAGISAEATGAGSTVGGADCKHRELNHRKLRKRKLGVDVPRTDAVASDIHIGQRLGDPAIPPASRSRAWSLATWLPRVDDRASPHRMSF